MDSKTNRIKLAKAVINELGYKTLIYDCKVTRGAVFQWKLNGLPKARELYLRLKFPKLNAWKLS